MRKAFSFCCAQSYQAALEADELGHGLLTFALIEEGLKEVEADRAPKDGRFIYASGLTMPPRACRNSKGKMLKGRGIGGGVCRGRRATWVVQTQPATAAKRSIVAICLCR